jgi:hypothetical protein
MNIRPTLGLMLAAVLHLPAAQGAEYKYSAITEAPAAREQGSVLVNKLTWECQGNRCTVSGPWLHPDVSACQALASKVGSLRSYGHSGAQLSATEMAQCNRNARERDYAVYDPARRVITSQQVEPQKTPPKAEIQDSVKPRVAVPKFGASGVTKAGNEQ